MIRRKRIPQHGETRTLTRFALLPRQFDYKGEKVLVWLEKFVKHQQFGGTGWRTTRLTTLSDALLEKLNPEPAAPVQQPLAQSASPFAGQLIAINNSQLGNLGQMLTPGLMQHYAQAQAAYAQAQAIAVGQQTP